ncbi:sensor histidine kinase [Hydrogenophaga sp. RWCD_12]|uniref:sensor histidine kinase n=1 Tax=Hydrogenophaga sp. RWCD_12 TaxID=3391190 RepID=UPI0039852E80
MKALGTALFTPSLVRRVVVALLAAFALVWVTLVVVDFAEFRRATRTQEGLQRAVRALAASLDFDDAARAAQVMQATETQYNLLRAESVPVPFGPILMELARPDGTRVYASKGLQTQALPAAGTEPALWTVQGKRHGMATLATPHWRIRMLEPALTDAEAVWLIARNLVKSMLIAFPLVLLPLWLAVRRGLRPLRALVQRVAERPPADFSPLTLDLRYAELQPLEHAFNELLRQARSGIQSERGFVQDAAHELRTPLAVMAAQAHALAAEDDPQRRAQVRVELEHAIGRASHLVHQLLTLARLESSPPPSRQATDLVELVQGALARAEPKALARSIDLGLEAPDALVAEVDAQVLLSALENLVHNALAYVHEGARVTVTLGRDGEQWRLRVADNGPGIAPEERPRLMERFQRGRDARTSGTGLGLAIVAQAARQLGGSLHTVDGLDGRGIGFEICGPA